MQVVPKEKHTRTENEGLLSTSPSSPPCFKGLRPSSLGWWTGGAGVEDRDLVTLPVVKVGVCFCPRQPCQRSPSKQEG